MPAVESIADDDIVPGIVGCIRIMLVHCPLDSDAIALPAGTDGSCLTEVVSGDGYFTAGLDGLRKYNGNEKARGKMASFFLELI